MRTFVLTALTILLFSIGHTTYAQSQEKEYTYQVKIVNSKGKPQPNIYAYHENRYTKEERKYFKSDKKGNMKITSTNAYVDMYIDSEKSNGFHRKHFYISPKLEETVVYDTKKDIEKTMKGKVLTTCQEMPEYPGGLEECLKFLSKKTWEHPVIKKENGKNGHWSGSPNVIIQFIVDKKGNIAFPVVVRGIAPHMDQAAIDVLLSMPKWKPGKHKGKTVNCLYAIAVTVRYL